MKLRSKAKQGSLKPNVTASLSMLQVLNLFLSLVNSRSQVGRQAINLNSSMLSSIGFRRQQHQLVQLTSISLDEVDHIRHDISQWQHCESYQVSLTQDAIQISIQNTIQYIYRRVQEFRLCAVHYISALQSVYCTRFNGARKGRGCSSTIRYTTVDRQFVTLNLSLTSCGGRSRRR